METAWDIYAPRFQQNVRTGSSTLTPIIGSYGSDKFFAKQRDPTLNGNHGNSGFPFPALNPTFRPGFNVPAGSLAAGNYKENAVNNELLFKENSLNVPKSFKPTVLCMNSTPPRPKLTETCESLPNKQDKTGKIWNPFQSPKESNKTLASSATESKPSTLLKNSFITQNSEQDCTSSLAKLEKMSFLRNQGVGDQGFCDRQWSNMEAKSDLPSYPAMGIQGAGAVNSSMYGGGGYNQMPGMMGGQNFGNQMQQMGFPSFPMQPETGYGKPSFTPGVSQPQPNFPAFMNSQQSSGQLSFPHGPGMEAQHGNNGNHSFPNAGMKLFPVRMNSPSPVRSPHQGMPSTGNSMNSQMVPGARPMDSIPQNSSHSNMSVAETAPRGDSVFKNTARMSPFPSMCSSNHSLSQDVHSEMSQFSNRETMRNHPSSSLMGNSPQFLQTPTSVEAAKTQPKKKKKYNSTKRGQNTTVESTAPPMNASTEPSVASPVTGKDVTPGFSSSAENSSISMSNSSSTSHNQPPELSHSVAGSSNISHTTHTTGCESENRSQCDSGNKHIDQTSAGSVEPTSAQTHSSPQMQAQNISEQNTCSSVTMATALKEDTSDQNCNTNSAGSNTGQSVAMSTNIGNSSPTSSVGISSQLENASSAAKDESVSYADQISQQDLSSLLDTGLPDSRECTSVSGNTANTEGGESQTDSGKPTPSSVTVVSGSDSVTEERSADKNQNMCTDLKDSGGAFSAGLNLDSTAVTQSGKDVNGQIPDSVNVPSSQSDRVVSQKTEMGTVLKREASDTMPPEMLQHSDSCLTGSLPDTSVSQDSFQSLGISGQEEDVASLYMNFSSFLESDAGREFLCLESNAQTAKYCGSPKQEPPDTEEPKTFLDLDAKPPRGNRGSHRGEGHQKVMYGEYGHPHLQHGHPVKNSGPGYGWPSNRNPNYGQPASSHGNQNFQYNQLYSQSEMNKSQPGGMQMGGMHGYHGNSYGQQQGAPMNQGMGYMQYNQGNGMNEGQGMFPGNYPSNMQHGQGTGNMQMNPGFAGNQSGGEQFGGRNFVPQRNGQYGSFGGEQNPNFNGYHQSNQNFPPNMQMGMRQGQMGQQAGQPGPGSQASPIQQLQGMNFNREVNPAGSPVPNISQPPAPTTTAKSKKKKKSKKRKADAEIENCELTLPVLPFVQISPTVGPLIVENEAGEAETALGYHDDKFETIFDFSTEGLSPIACQFLQIEQRLCRKLLPIKFRHPVSVIYNPLIYAFQPHKNFVRKYCTSQRPILFLGMNPGPYGMSQNAIPFGEVAVVRDWLKITGNVYKPEREHPKRAVYGLTCTRNEVSGSRFWGLFQKICQVPEKFFQNCFVNNICPQAFMAECGKNITPPQLPSEELSLLNEACDEALVELVRLLNVRLVIAVGKFVQTRAGKALKDAGISDISVETIMHPSPINPTANRSWEPIVAKQLQDMGAMQYLCTDPSRIPIPPPDVAL